ncbi:hypothetical protein SLA2020_253830 [Shorea laevis]
MSHYTVCLCFTRKFRTVEPGPPQDVKDAFEKYAEGGKHMTAEGLQQFLEHVQGEAVMEARETVEKVLQKRHHNTKTGMQTLTLEDFQHYLFSADLNPPIRDKVHHDMEAPLSHYFIFTGHNSYLTGNQLWSDSSDVPIIKAVKNGVRVVELDLWPNSDESDVEVRHGWTLTTPVELTECLKSIKDNAFTENPYPVIITLEDHLTPPLQTKVAQVITDTFQETLFCPKECEGLEEFPSPEDLKNKIIISTKPPTVKKKTKPPQQFTADNEDISNNNSNKGKRWRLGAPPLSFMLPKFFKCGSGASKKGPRKNYSSDQEDEDKIDDDDDHSSECSQDNEDNDISDPGSIQSKALEYKHLISIHATKHKGELKDTLKVEFDKVKRISLSEGKLKRATLLHAIEVVRFTQNNVLRIFPKGTRFDSSNYNPLPGWMHGAQMVAFNMQGHGKYLWWMQGLFRSNGGCGYVKKPKILMQDDPVFDPKAKLPVKTTLKVKVYMGDGWRKDFTRTHFDCYSPPDFYARVGIVGVPADETKMDETKKKNDNWTPVWDQEFTFALTVPKLALLRVEVRDRDEIDKDDFAGQTCLLVSELKQGIRAVPLYKKEGDKYDFVKLLMRFEFV